MHQVATSQAVKFGGKVLKPVAVATLVVAGSTVAPVAAAAAPFVVPVVASAAAVFGLAALAKKAFEK